MFEIIKSWALKFCNFFFIIFNNREDSNKIEDEKPSTSTDIDEELAPTVNSPRSRSISEMAKNFMDKVYKDAKDT